MSYMELLHYIDVVVIALSKMITMGGMYLSLSRGYYYIALRDKGHDDCFQTFCLALIAKKDNKWWFLVSKRQNFEKFTKDNENIPMS